MAYFRKAAEETAQSEHPAGNQTLINEALREYIASEAALAEIGRTGNYSVIDPRNPPPWWKPVGASRGNSRSS